MFKNKVLQPVWAYKFNDKSDRCLNELTQSKVYGLMEKVNSFIEKHPTAAEVVPNTLTEKEEDWLLDNFYSNTYFQNGSIPFQGWAFDFKGICNEYWMKLSIDNEIKLIAILAPNLKSAIRYVKRNLLSKDDEILEIREP